MFLEAAILGLAVGGYKLVRWARRDARDRRAMEQAAKNRCHVPGCLRAPAGADAQGRITCRAHAT